MKKYISSRAFLFKLLTMKNYLSLVKFSHTVFALPFAFVGFFLAYVKLGDVFSLKLLGLVVLCMVFVRSAAMGFNRYLDREIDKDNPRTVGREIPAGVISARSALMFVVISSLLFMATTWFINPLVFKLSPVALLITLGYSYTKRFTFLCHFVLGLGLALAPIGAYLAAGGNFDLIPILYSFGVLCWVGGFDIMYALQDEAFDKKHNLNSIPVALGTKNALNLSKVLHSFSALFFVYGGYLLFTSFDVFSWLLWVGTTVFVGILYYQHTLVKVNDLSKINIAFFTTNGIASVVFGTLFILDIFI